MPAGYASIFFIILLREHVLLILYASVLCYQFQKLWSKTEASVTANMYYPKKVLLSSYLVRNNCSLKYSLQEITNFHEIILSVVISREILQEVVFCLKLGQ